MGDKPYNEPAETRADLAAQSLEAELHASARAEADAAEARAAAESAAAGDDSEETIKKAAAARDAVLKQHTSKSAEAKVEKAVAKAADADK